MEEDSSGYGSVSVPGNCRVGDPAIVRTQSGTVQDRLGVCVCLPSQREARDTAVLADKSRGTVEEIT